MGPAQKQYIIGILTLKGKADTAQKLAF